MDIEWEEDRKKGGREKKEERERERDTHTDG